MTAAPVCVFWKKAGAAAASFHSTQQVPSCTSMICSLEDFLCFFSASASSFSDESLPHFTVLILPSWFVVTYCLWTYFTVRSPAASAVFEATEATRQSERKPSGRDRRGRGCGWWGRRRLCAYITIAAHACRVNCQLFILNKKYCSTKRSKI